MRGPAPDNRARRLAELTAQLEALDEAIEEAEKRPAQLTEERRTLLRIMREVDRG